MYCSFGKEPLPSTALFIIRVQVAHSHTYKHDSQDHNVAIRTLLTSHTLYQQTNITMDKFLISKSQATDSPVAKTPKLRKYDESYLQFGFTVTGTTEQRPQ